MRRKKIHRKPFGRAEDPCYDLIYDRDAVTQSVAKQYGILPSEQEDMHYCEWLLLVGGLMHDTPLGQLVSIRQEKDQDTIKRFGDYEKRIRREWNSFCLRKKYGAEVQDSDKKKIADYFDNLFKNMFGG